MAATRFSDSATPNSDLTKSRPKYFRFDDDDFSHAFSDKNKFHSISGIFESTSGVCIALPGQDLHFFAPAFLAVCVRYVDNAGQNKAKRASRGL